MAKDNNLTDFLTNLAETIRTNDGTNGLIDPQDFSDRIALGTKTITPSAVEQIYNAKSDDSVYGYKTVTVKANSEGPKATVTSGTSYSSISKTITFDAGNGRFNVALSGTVSAPTVGTAGYISSSAGTKNTSTATGSTTLPIVSGGNAITGTAKVTPVISNTSASVSGKTQITASPSKSTSGISTYYIAVSTGALSNTINADYSVSTAGYVDSDHVPMGHTEQSVGANASGTYYIPLATAEFEVDGASIKTKSGKAGWVPASTTVGTVASGSTTTPTASGASTSTSLSGTTLTVSRSVTPTVVAGYISTGTAGTVTITGTVPTETKSASGSGDITPSSGKLLSKVTVGAGSATPSATVAGSSSALTSPTAMNNQYFTVTPKASVGTAGWISSISDGTQLKYKVKDGSATTPATSITANPSAVTWDSTNSKFKTTTSASKSITPTVSAGWVASGTSGNITVSGSTDVPTVGITATLSGTPAATPVIQNKTVAVSGKTQIEASPTTSTTGISTYYMAVETPEDLNAIYASPGIESAGYTDGAHYNSSSDSGAAGANASGTYYIPVASGSVSTSGGGLSKGTASGGGLSGGGLTAGTGEVSITQNPEITPSVSRSYTVSGATDSTYGVTTTQPSSGDYATFDPGATVNKEAKAKGRGSVTRAAVTRAAFSQTVTRADVKDTRTAGYIPARAATTVISSDSTTVSLGADSTTIPQTSGTSNYSSESSSTTTVNAGTNIYIPVSTASASGGTASASASIAKQPSASASATATGFTPASSATSYYVTTSASSASGYSTASASATGGSASVTKGITAGASASGSSSGNKSATSTEVTASDSQTIYIPTGSVAINDSTLSVSPSVTPTSTVSASGSSVTLGTKTTTQPTSGRYITVTGGNSATTGSATAGESATVTKTAGYIAAGTSTISSTATATAAANSTTAYYPIDSSTVSVSDSTLSVSPSVTPTAVASATGNITLTASSSQPSSGFYIKAHGGNNATTGSATSGESSTVTWTKGYLDASTSSTQKTITSTATASAAASSKDQYYSIPTATFAAQGADINCTSSGYTGTGTVGTIASGSATGNAGTITYVSHTQDSSNKKKFTVTGSVTAPAPTVSAGYVSSGTAGTATNRTVSLTITDAQAQAAVGSGSATGNAGTLSNVSYTQDSSNKKKFNITADVSAPSPTVSAGYISTGTAGSAVNRSTSITITDAQAQAAVGNASMTDVINTSGIGTYTTSGTSEDYSFYVQGGHSVDTAGYAAASAATYTTNFYKIKAGSASADYAYAEQDSAGTGAITVSKRYFSIQGTGSATAGWISSVSNGTKRYYTVQGASTFTMTGSAVTDEVSVGSVSSGYYPISAKVKGTISAGTAGWFSSSGAVQASTATQVGKIAAAEGTPALVSTTAGSSTAAINNTDSMAEIASTSGKTAGTDYFRVKATATGTAGSVTPMYSVSIAGYIASTVTGSASSVPVSSDTTGQTINVIKAAITNNTTLPSGASSSGTINAGSYIKIEPGYNKNTLYYRAAPQTSCTGSAGINTSGITFELTNNSGISVQGKYVVSSAGYIPTGTYANTTQYIKDIAVYSGKTLNSISLESNGDTYATLSYLYGNDTISNRASLENIQYRYSEDFLKIGGMSGTVKVDYVGSGSTDANLYLNWDDDPYAYKTKIIGKTVYVSPGRHVGADLQVTDSDGNIIRASGSSGSNTMSNSNCTLSTTNTSGVSVSASAAGYTVSTDGWISSGTYGSASTGTKYITDLTVGSSKTLNSVTLSGGSGAVSHLTTLNVNGYSNVDNFIINSAYGRIGNSTTTISSNNSNNQGTIYIPHKTDGKGNVYVAPYTENSTYDWYHVIDNGNLTWAAGSAASVNGTNTFSYSTNSTWSTSSTSSGIYASAYATGVSKRYTVSAAGWIDTGTYGATNGTLSSSTYYLTGLTIDSGKTLGSITNNGTITYMMGTGTLTNMSNGSGTAGNLTITNNGAGGTSGTVTITNNGNYSTSSTGTVNVVTNAGDYGKIRVGGTTDSTASMWITYPTGLSGHYVNIPAGKTVTTIQASSYSGTTVGGTITNLSLGGGTSSYRGAMIGTLTMNDYSQISTLNSTTGSYISTYKGTGTISTYTNTGTITNMTGSRTISYLGTTSAAGGLTISNLGNSSSYISTLHVDSTRYGRTTLKAPNLYNSSYPTYVYDRELISKSASTTTSFRYLMVNSPLAASYVYERKSYIYSTSTNARSYGSISTTGSPVYLFDISNSSTQYIMLCLMFNGYITSSQTLSLIFSSSTSYSASSAYTQNITIPANCNGVLFRIIRRNTTYYDIYPTFFY